MLIKAVQFGGIKYFKIVIMFVNLSQSTEQISQMKLVSQAEVHAELPEGMLWM